MLGMLVYFCSMMSAPGIPHPNSQFSTIPHVSSVFQNSHPSHNDADISCIFSSEIAESEIDSAEEVVVLLTLLDDFPNLLPFSKSHHCVLDNRSFNLASHRYLTMRIRC